MAIGTLKRTMMTALTSQNQLFRRLKDLSHTSPTFEENMFLACESSYLGTDTDIHCAARFFLCTVGSVLARTFSGTLPRQNQEKKLYTVDLV